MKTFINELLFSKDNYLVIKVFIALLSLLFFVDFISNGRRESSGYIIIALLFLLITLDIIRDYIDKKIQLEKFKYVDLNYFNFNGTKGVDPLDAYIDICMSNRLVLMGYKEGSYITEVQEKEILKEVLEEVASNMGQLMKSKFELIYGVGHVDEVLANKCFIRVSLFVANNNKPRYSNNEIDKAKLEKQLVDHMMMK